MQGILPYTIRFKTQRAIHRACALETPHFGNPLPSKTRKYEGLTKIKALAVLSWDTLFSVAYATEEIQLVLVLVGPAAM